MNRRGTISFQIFPSCPKLEQIGKEDDDNTEHGEVESLSKVTQQ